MVLLLLLVLGGDGGIDLGGNIQSVQTAVVGTRMNDGNVWYSWVDYDGSTHDLEVRLSQSSSRPSQSASGSFARSRRTARVASTAHGRTSSGRRATCERSV